MNDDLRYNTHTHSGGNREFKNEDADPEVGGSLDFEDDPHFQNISEEDEGPKHQVVEKAGFLFDNGEAVLAIEEKLIGIPNWVQWDVKGNVMTIMLLDGSTVAVKSPVPKEKAQEFKAAERIRLATLWDDNNQYIVHHVPFTIQDF